MRTNRQLLKDLRTPVARFYPCDLHVHSPGSFDVCQRPHFQTLPAEFQEQLNGLLANPTSGSAPFPLSKQPLRPAEHDQQVTTPALVDAFFRGLCDRKDQLVEREGTSASDGWAIVGITDHNTCHFSTALARHAWEYRQDSRLIILPGLELEVHFPVDGSNSLCQIHMLCLYRPGTTASDIRVAINEARTRNTANWDAGDPIDVADLAEFVQGLRLHARFPAICIPAHVWSNKGIESAPKKLIFDAIEAEICRVEGELDRARVESSEADQQHLQQVLTQLMDRSGDFESLHMDVLRLIGRCGFDALQVRDHSHESHYRHLHRFRENHGRAVPIVCSDAHTLSDVFSCSSGIPYAKLPLPDLSRSGPDALFEEMRYRVLRFGETRTTYASPGHVTTWIEGLEIVPDAKNARGFWQSNPPSTDIDDPRPFTLSLSRNLNCFVGGRGSGKSAGIEAIAFLTQPDHFSDAAARRQKERPEWYERAAATLSGCRLRLVWKSSATDGIGRLPKRALFVTRYFDADHRHAAVDKRDADENAIVDDAVQIPRVRILRAHEIEDTAKPKNLRRLFDDLCGSRIQRLSVDVSQIREELLCQRAEILTTCESLAQLTREGGALRQYGIRKIQFETVDREDLKAKYEKIDAAGAVHKAAKRISKKWATLSVAPTLRTLEANVSDFLSSAAKEVSTEDGESRTGYEELHAIVTQPSSEAKTPLQQGIVSALHSAADVSDMFTGTLTDTATLFESLLSAQQDELVKQGLPSGSSEREAKKRAFDDAKTAHAEYGRQVQRLKDQFAVREGLHNQLVAACRELTNLRRETAETITSQLARDLDEAVLRIEVDAQPMADTSSFGQWLQENFDPVFGRYKSQRRLAILKSRLLPSTLRDLLLAVAVPDLTALCIDEARAEDGRINNEEAQLLYDVCRGRMLVQLDEIDGWSDEFTATLPDDIRAGVICFPQLKGGHSLCIGSVLQLDEIVLDDLPVIRLNDRPLDPRSEARPLSELSPGQRCSAILPILLLSGDYPLIIDQPEENLDNRLIRQVIVNILASMKLRRQIIIATHNPNLPVLGDVEQCVVMQATGRDLSEVVSSGNLDAPSVSRYITDIMEGGREAFQYRHSIYQTHWKGHVEEGSRGPAASSHEP